jgi:manganese efflux pump family protein
MPLVGLGLGRALGTAVGAAAAYVAIALLAVAGLAMLREGEAGEGATTLALGLSVSLDELAIGFALGLLHVSVWLAVVLIAAQAFVVTQVGLRAGSRIGPRLREGAERVAAVVLIGLAVALLVERVV